MSQMDEKRRVGLFGGSFDPIHKGHIEIAKCALEEYCLSEVIFLPAGNPPHKVGNDITAANDRYEMTKIAISDISGFRVSDYEIQKGGLSYTYLTLQEYRKRYPMHEVYFIMGADSLLDFDKWVHPERIAEFCTILAAVRDDADLSRLSQTADDLKRRLGARVLLLHCLEIPVSSHEIRDALRTGDLDSVSGYLDARVLDYILAKQLYV